MIVLDASAAIDLLLDRPPFAEELGRRLGTGVAAPHLLDAEVGQVLRRFVSKGELSVERARDALTDLSDLRLVRYPHAPLAQRAFDLRDNLTFCDALYVALAEGLDAPLVTLDARLAEAPGHRAKIEVLGRSRRP